LKRIKKTFVLVLTVVLAVTSATAIAFAEIDYNQWNSQGSYPQDIVNTPLFAPVKALLDKKIFTGYDDGTFRPQNYINRAEIAVALTKMTNRLSELDAAANVNKFSDLAGYDWAKAYINVMSNAGIVKGSSPTTFGPGKNISYAELITMLIRTKSGAATELEAYGTWPDNYIQFAQMYGMLGDVVITDWSAPATRGDVAKLIYRNMPKSSASAGDATLSATTISAGGGPAYLSVSPGASGVTTTFQWYKNGTALAGETSNTLFIPSPVAGDKYYVIVKTKEAGAKETTVISDVCTVVP